MCASYHLVFLTRSAYCSHDSPDYNHTQAVLHTSSQEHTTCARRRKSSWSFMARIILVGVGRSWGEEGRILYHQLFFSINEKGSPLDWTVKSVIILAASHLSTIPFIFSPDIACVLETAIHSRDFIEVGRGVKSL